MDLTGRTLGPYVVEQKLGEGGMGAVYRATHRFLNRSVALKVLAPELARDADFVARFRREGQAVAALEHPNIVSIYEAGESDGVSFLAMRFINGRDLSQHIAQRGALPLAETLAILEQAASALDAAHARGIIHRDIKPGNLMLEGERVYLTDFGIAKSADAEFKTRPGMIVGTPVYMAPEQIQGQAIDQRVDVYALGVMAYQMLSGEVPFAAPTPTMVIYRKLSEPVPDLRSLRPDLSVSVALAVQRAMAPQAEGRYASAGQFIAALREATQADQGTLVVNQQQTWQQQQNWQQQHQQNWQQQQHQQQVWQHQQPAKSRKNVFLSIGGGLVAGVVMLLLASGGQDGTHAADNTPVPAATATTAAQATEEPVSEGLSYRTYESTAGGFSIDYPGDWSVSQDADAVRFTAPGNEARATVSYSDLGVTREHDQLVDEVSTGLNTGFGDSYQELDRVPQEDGSTRIDFQLNQQPLLVGSSFVEQRGTGLYLLMLIEEQSKRDTYAPIFEHMIQSYRLPSR